MVGIYYKAGKQSREYIYISFVSDNSYLSLSSIASLFNDRGYVLDSRIITT